MRWFRVTRYDPALRDERGAYTRVTWISVGQVGKTFDGEVLTLDEYERVELLYLEAVRSFAAAAGVDVLEATKVRGGNRPGGSTLQEGEHLTLDDACTVVRSMLREEAWCQLQGVGVPFAVHVGYDLYMFIGTSGPTEDAVRAVRASGLFVDEDFLSPYAESPTLEDVRRLLDAPVDTVDDLAGLVATIDDAVAARNVEPGWDLAVWMLASGSEDLEIPNALVRQTEPRELPAGEHGAESIREVVDGLAGALDAWLSDDDGPSGRLPRPEFSASARQLLQDFEPHVPATGDDVERLRAALAPAVAEVSALGPAGPRWLLRHVVEELDVVDAMTSEADAAGDTLPEDPADRFRDALDVGRFAVLGVRPTAALAAPTDDAPRPVLASGRSAEDDFVSPLVESSTLADVRQRLDMPVNTVDDLAELVATIYGVVPARNVEPGWDLVVWMLISGSDDLEISQALARQTEPRELPVGEYGEAWIRDVLDGLAGALDAWLSDDGDSPGVQLARPEFSASARQLLQDFELHIPATGDDVERLRAALAPAVAEAADSGPTATRWLLRHVLEELDVVDAMTSETDEPGDTLPEDPADRFRDALDMARFAVLGVRPTAMLDR